MNGSLSHRSITIIKRVDDRPRIKLSTRHFLRGQQTSPSHQHCRSGSRNPANSSRATGPIFLLLFIYIFHSRGKSSGIETLGRELGYKSFGELGHILGYGVIQIYCQILRESEEEEAANDGDV